MKVCTVSAAQDQKTLIKHCSHQCFEEVNYGSNQKSKTYVFFKHKIFLSDSSQDVIIGAYVLNTEFYQTCSKFSTSGPEPSRHIRPSNKVTVDPCLDGFISKHINLQPFTNITCKVTLLNCIFH